MASQANSPTLHPDASTELPSGSSGGALFRLAKIVPFFLAAALHLSALFKVFGALPIAYAHLKYGRIAGIICSITNIAIVWAITGRADAAWFFVIAIVLGTTTAECMKLKLRVEWTVLVTTAVMVLASVSLLVGYSHKMRSNPIQVVKAYVGNEVDEFVRNAEKYKASGTLSSQDLDKVLIDPEMTKQNILEAAPSVLAIFLLLLVAANALLILKLNLGGAREVLSLKPDYFKHWKAPDHMVWLALAAGFSLVVDVPVVSDVGLNVFRVVMAIYAIQGLAIINYMFDVWGLKGFFRPLGYVLAVTFLLPLVISLGFFDLWMNFREKFKV